jgi:hypothetical protein
MLKKLLVHTHHFLKNNKIFHETVLLLLSNLLIDLKLSTALLNSLKSLNQNIQVLLTPLIQPKLLLMYLKHNKIYLQVLHNFPNLLL